MALPAQQCTNNNSQIHCENTLKRGKEKREMEVYRGSKNGHSKKLASFFLVSQLNGTT